MAESYKDIRTFADAVAAVGVDSPLVEEWGMTVGERGTATGLTAYAELRIICAAMGGGRPAGREEVMFLPGFCRLTEEELDAAKYAGSVDIVDEVHRTGWRLSDGTWLAAFGRGMAVPLLDGTWLSCATAEVNYFAGLDCHDCHPIELALPSEEAALWCGRQFIGWWAAYLLGRELAGPGWRGDTELRDTGCRAGKVREAERKLRKRGGRR